MRYFLDTEFIEYPPRESSNGSLSGYKGTIDLVSIGIVAEDGREYYAIHNGFDALYASEWVDKNVLLKLEDHIHRKPMDQIRTEILEFAPPEENPEFYAYFCNYDWVVFCWIFGSMIDLPTGYPMWCRDLTYLMKMFSIAKDDLPHQDEATHHNALADARWNRAAFQYINHYVETEVNLWTRYPTPEITI